MVVSLITHLICCVRPPPNNNNDRQDYYMLHHRIPINLHWPDPTGPLNIPQALKYLLMKGILSSLYFEVPGFGWNFLRLLGGGPSTQPICQTSIHHIHPKSWAKLQDQSECQWTSSSSPAAFGKCPETPKRNLGLSETECSTNINQTSNVMNKWGFNQQNLSDVRLPLPFQKGSEHTTVLPEHEIKTSKELKLPSCELTYPLIQSIFELMIFPTSRLVGYVSRNSLRLTATFGEKFSEASRIATKSHLHHDEGDRQGNPELISGHHRSKNGWQIPPVFFPGKFQETW